MRYAYGTALGLVAALLILAHAMASNPPPWAPTAAPTATPDATGTFTAAVGTAAAHGVAATHAAHANAWATHVAEVEAEYGGQ